MKFLADENLNYNLVRALKRKIKKLDILRVQEIGLTGKSDPEILEWSANQSRVLLTHDVATMTKYAYERINNKLKMPGVIEIPCNSSMKQILDDLQLMIECSKEDEIENQIIYLPLN